MSIDQAASVSEPNVVDLVIAGAGGLQELARKCGVRYQAVQKWRASRKVPPERVLAAESASGVARERIRPDLYPPIEDRLQSGTG